MFESGFNFQKRNDEFFHRIKSICNDLAYEKEFITGLSKALTVISEFFDAKNANFYLILNNKVSSINSINENVFLDVDITDEEEKRLIVTNFSLDEQSISLYQCFSPFNTNKVIIKLLMPLSYNNNFLGFVTLGEKHIGEYTDAEKFIFTLTVNYLARLVYYSDSYIESSGKTAEEMCLKNLIEPLSSVYVKSYIEQRLKEQIKESIRYSIDESIVLVKLNDFENIRKKYGQQVINKILYDSGEFINHFVRKDVDLVGKYSEDSFIILLLSTGFDGALIFADRLKVKLASMKFDNFPELSFSFSLGMTSIEKTDKNKEGVMEKLVSALDYSVKEGINRLYYNYGGTITEHVSEIEKISGLSSEIIRDNIENTVFITDEHGNEIDFTKTSNKNWFNIPKRH